MLSCSGRTEGYEYESQSKETALKLTLSQLLSPISLKVRLISDDASIKAGLLTRQSVSRRNGGYRRSHLSFILDQIGTGEKREKWQCH